MNAKEAFEYLNDFCGKREVSRKKHLECDHALAVVAQALNDGVAAQEKLIEATKKITDYERQLGGKPNA